MATSQSPIATTGCAIHVMLSLEISHGVPTARVKLSAGPRLSIRLPHPQRYPTISLSLVIESTRPGCRFHRRPPDVYPPLEKIPPPNEYRCSKITRLGTFKNWPPGSEPGVGRWSLDRRAESLWNRTSGIATSDQGQEGS